MRALFAILQLLLLTLPTFAPAAALRTGRDESKLPACCRRTGAHHCTMPDAQRAAILAGVQATAIPERCPMNPRALPAAQHGASSLMPSAIFFAQLASHPAAIAQTLAMRRISQDRSQQKRGPPATA